MNHDQPPSWIEAYKDAVQQAADNAPGGKNNLPRRQHLPTSTLDEVRQHTTEHEDRMLDIKLKVQCREGNKVHYRNKARDNSLEFIHDQTYTA